MPVQMTAIYKVAITAGVAQLRLESAMKPQNSSSIHLCLICPGISDCLHCMIVLEQFPNDIVSWWHTQTWY